jgi:hypothetical protein
MIDPADVFKAAELAFEAAAARSDVEVRYRVAGRVLALRFGGSALAAKLLPAFAHLEPVESAPADLVICSWDDVSSEVSLAEFMPEADRHGLKYVEGSVRLAWEFDSRSLQAYDPGRCLALFRIPAIEELAVWEQGAPFRRILHWWSAGLGLQLVHGAAVGTKAGGALLVGRGGSGKSTTALACVGSSLGYVADDYCLLEPGTPSRVHSIYGSGKADSASIARLPYLADAFRASPIDQQGKSIIFIAEHVPQAILYSFPLRAVVVPKIVPGVACRAEVLPRGEALRALAPSTLFQMPGDRAKSLSRMSALIRDLPCFRLYIGNDPAAAQPFLEAIIAGRGLSS